MWDREARPACRVTLSHKVVATDSEVAAVVVLNPGSALDEDTLRQFLAERIAKHKIPARIWFRDEQLPRNASGKFLKRELRAQLVGD